MIHVVGALDFDLIVIIELVAALLAWTEIVVKPSRNMNRFYFD